MEIEPIAYIYNPYTEKFGIPRQSGLADTVSRIVFTGPFRNPDCVRGLDAYSHLWLIASFSDNLAAGWTPTVRPPKLGGNTRVGVFATRSSFRPNGLTLSSVKLLKIEPDTPEGPVLTVAGADLKNGTPIYDIKPYLPYTDSHPDAKGSFGEAASGRRLEVEIPPELQTCLDSEALEEVKDILALDPRPGYQHDPERIYGMLYGDKNILFRADDSRLTGTAIQ